MKAIIYGAGKISRGFISQLLSLAGYEIVYVDINTALLAQLSARKTFTVQVMGAPEKNTLITGYHCLSLTDTAAVARELKTADLVFTSVGGKNLQALGATMAASLTALFNDGGRGREGDLNIITCENWKDPARVLSDSIRSHLTAEHAQRFDRSVGVSQAVVMRSAVEPTPDMLKSDPLMVPVQDFWQLPVDSDKIKGKPPAVQGIVYQENFAGFLERKIFTYNTGNATIAYLGYLKKRFALADAANDEFIVSVLDQVYQETNKALSLKHHCSLEEQTRFSEQAKRKYQDYAIIDDVRRHANDPIRKLGPEDRLIGAARLVQRYHLPVAGISTAIAAALYYDNPDDAVAVSLQTLRQARGIDHVLQTVCHIPPDSELAKTVKEKIAYLKETGIIEHE